MTDFAANLLGVLGLAVADRIEETARQVLNHVGETPAALVIIGYGFGPSNEQLRSVLGLSHPGTVRLVDRLVRDGLAERHKGTDKRAIALYLTRDGMVARQTLLEGRLSAIRSFLQPLSETEQSTLTTLLSKMLSSMETTDIERRTLCRLCDDSVCEQCPIPADFRS